MRIILTQDVPHLGSLGDEVQVKAGFARNYLLPQGMALAANAKNADHLAHRRKRLEVLRADAIEQAKTEGEKVSGMEVVVEAKAGLNGRLFGSVTNRNVQAALKELGYDLDRRSISLAAPIKNVGNYTATVRLHTAVKTEIAVKVVSIALTDEEKAQQAAEAEAAAAAPAAGEPQAAGEGEAEGSDGEAKTEAGGSEAKAEAGGSAGGEAPMVPAPPVEDPPEAPKAE